MALDKSKPTRAPHGGCEARTAKGQDMTPGRAWRSRGLPSAGAVMGDPVSGVPTDHPGYARIPKRRLSWQPRSKVKSLTVGEGAGLASSSPTAARDPPELLTEGPESPLLNSQNFRQPLTSRPWLELGLGGSINNAETGKRYSEGRPPWRMVNPSGRMLRNRGRGTCQVSRQRVGCET